MIVYFEYDFNSDGIRVFSNFCVVEKCGLLNVDGYYSTIDEKRPGVFCWWIDIDYLKNISTMSGSKEAINYINFNLRKIKLNRLVKTNK